MRVPFKGARREADRAAHLGRRDAAPVPLLLYTRAGCQLCDQLERTLATLRLPEPFTLERVDIGADAALEAALGESIPVLTAGGRTAAKGRSGAAALARRLERQFRAYRDEGPVTPHFEEDA